jgi:hypothetical protein
VYAVKVNGVRVAAAVDESYPDMVTRRAAQGGARNPVIVRPARKGNSRSNLNHLILGDQAILAERLPGGQSTDRAIVKVSQQVSGVKAIEERVYITFDHIAESQVIAVLISLSMHSRGRVAQEKPSRRNGSTG